MDQLWVKWKKIFLNQDILLLENVLPESCQQIWNMIEYLCVCTYTDTWDFINFLKAS